MRRGEVYLVALEPTPGSTARATPGPAVIVSSDAANRAAERTGRGILTVAPVTPGTGRVFPFQVLLPAEACGLAVDSKAQAEQIRAVSVGRIEQRLGCVPPVVMRQLDEAIRRHLAL